MVMLLRSETATEAEPKAGPELSKVVNERIGLRCVLYPLNT